MKYVNALYMNIKIAYFVIKIRKYNIVSLQSWLAKQLYLMMFVCHISSVLKCIRKLAQYHILSDARLIVTSFLHFFFFLFCFNDS